MPNASKQIIRGSQDEDDIESVEVAEQHANAEEKGKNCDPIGGLQMLRAVREEPNLEAPRSRSLC
jgi:hypothetical protein